MTNLSIKDTQEGIELKVKIVPGSSKTQIVGTLDNMIKIKVAAPPEKGKANQCLIAFLSKRLSVKKNDIEIVSGSTNPIKILSITGRNRVKLKAVLIAESSLEK